MVIAILADEVLKEELLSKPFSSSTEIIWADSIRSLGIIDADVYMDLNFELDRERISKLKFLLPKPVIVNSVIHTVTDIRESFVRINGWPTMLGNEVAEVAIGSHVQPEAISSVFEQIGWKVQLAPDVPGMIVPRIVSMIINEAWYTYGERISTKTEIDAAMKLGTNYPYGPFEWGDKIGLEKITGLLQALAETDARYTIAPALTGLNKKDAVHFKY